MYRILTIVFAALLAVSALSTSVAARTMTMDDAAIAELAMPAVVNIAAWKIRPATEAGGAPRRVKIYASGFIIDPSGVIVTNKHVVDGSFDFVLLFSNGDRVPAKVLAVAPMIDLALLKVDVDKRLPALKWGEAGRVGDGVLAMGNPLGFGISVTAGIISALNRDIQDTPFDNYMQTDAAINHGNSGGPLVDANGDVVGVDTAFYNPNDAGGFIGIGLAIPAETARFVVERLLDPAHHRPGWLGLKLQDLTPSLSQALRLGDVQGSIIASVDSDGPASDAGLQPGDVLSTVGNVKFSNSRAFMREIVQTRVGTQTQLTIWRDRKEQVVKAIVAEWPNFMSGGGVVSVQAAQAMLEQEPDHGVQLAPLTDEARKRFGLGPGLSGVLVTSVDAESEARDLGIAPGDVFSIIQGAPVATPDDVKKAVRSAHEERLPFIAILVQGKGGARWVSLSVGRTGS